MLVHQEEIASISRRPSERYKYAPFARATCKGAGSSTSCVKGCQIFKRLCLCEKNSDRSTHGMRGAVCSVLGVRDVEAFRSRLRLHSARWPVGFLCSVSRT